MITLTEKMKILITRSGKQQQEIAAALNMSRQNLNNKIRRGTWYPEELEAFAAAVGCSVGIIFTDNATGEQL